MGQILEGIRNNILESQAHPYSWSVSSNPPQFAANNYQQSTAQNIGRANANIMVSVTNIPSYTSDPVSEITRQPLIRQNNEQSTMTTDSESASTTPVSDTTASDMEIIEPNIKPPETEESLMEESTPIQNKLHSNSIIDV